MSTPFRFFVIGRHSNAPGDHPTHLLRQRRRHSCGHALGTFPRRSNSRSRSGHRTRMKATSHQHTSLLHEAFSQNKRTSQNTKQTILCSAAFASVKRTMHATPLGSTQHPSPFFIPYFSCTQGLATIGLCFAQERLRHQTKEFSRS